MTRISSLLRLPVLRASLHAAGAAFVVAASAAVIAACEDSGDSATPDHAENVDSGADANVARDGEIDASLPDASDASDASDAGDRAPEYAFRGGAAMQTAVFSGCPVQSEDCNHGEETPSNAARYFFDVHAPERLRTYDDYATPAGVDVSAASLSLLSFGIDETYLAGPTWAYPNPPKGTTLGADGLGHRTSFRFVKPEFDTWPASLDEARTYTRDQVRRSFEDGAFYEEGANGCRRYHEHNRCEAEGEDDFIVWPWSVSQIVPGLSPETVWAHLVAHPFVVAFETRDQASTTAPRRGLAWVQLHGTVEDLNGGNRLAATGADLRIWLAE